jgi:hypothetical protein
MDNQNDPGDANTPARIQKIPAPPPTIIRNDSQASERVARSGWFAWPPWAKIVSVGVAFVAVATAIGVLTEIPNNVMQWFINLRELKRVETPERQDDIWDMPVANASAFAEMVISQNPRPESFFNLPEDAVGWSASVIFIEGAGEPEWKSIMTLTASRNDVSAWNMGSKTNRQWKIVFREDLLSFQVSEAEREKLILGRFNGVNGLVLGMPFETNMVVESGLVVLTVNNVKWRFEIPRQRPKWGIITMRQATDSNGIKTAAVLRMPVKDALIPPSFTNVYDGQ